MQSLAVKIKKSLEEKFNQLKEKLIQIMEGSIQMKFVKGNSTPQHKNSVCGELYQQFLKTKYNSPSTEN